MAAAERDSGDDEPRDDEPAHDEPAAHSDAGGEQPSMGRASADDAEAEADARDDRGGVAGDDGAPPPSGAANLVERAKEQIEELTGRQTESVSGLERADGGWRITLELVELARVPSSTDVLATYELLLDEDGEVLGYSRGRRYHRSRAGGEEAGE